MAIVAEERDIGIDSARRYAVPEIDRYQHTERPSASSERRSQGCGVRDVLRSAGAGRPFTRGGVHARAPAIRREPGGAGGGGGGSDGGAGSGDGAGMGGSGGGVGATTGGTSPSTLSAFGCEVANQIPLDPVSSMLLTGTAPDDYLRARPYGWDTNAYLGVAGGAGASVSAGGSVGLSRAFPLWSTNLSPAAMDAVRLLIGLFKLGLDVATVSPVSFVRDAIGIAPAFENTVVPMLLGPLTSIEIPMPEDA